MDTDTLSTILALALIAAIFTVIGLIDRFRSRRRKKNKKPSLPAD